MQFDHESLELLVRVAVALGLGAAIGLERQIRERTDELTRTLRKLERTNEELKTAKKVQVFRDFMVAKGRQWKY